MSNEWGRKIRQKSAGKPGTTDILLSMTDISILNPFTYDRPVQPQALIDREAEIEQLVRLAEGNHNCRLTAPRRYGKTSLLRKVCQEVGRVGMESVYVNFYGLLSTEEAAGRIEEAYRGSLQGPVLNFAMGLIRTIRPKITAPGTGISISLDLIDSDLGRRLGALLDLPAKIMEKHGKQTLIVFDEFQDVLETKPPLDGFIRSRIEQHGAEASYIFAGSHPAMMRRLFGDRSRPFYGQARAVKLNTLPDDALAEFVGAAFARTGRDVGELLESLLDTAKGHPQRAMMLAHFLWERTPEGQASDPDSWMVALEEIYREVEDEFDNAWKGLSDPDRRTLVAVASGPEQLLKKETLNALNLARSTAQDARDRLIDTGLIEERDDGLRIIDPLLAMWVRNGRQSLVAPEGSKLRA
jgi:uncharacterized protein